MNAAPTAFGPEWLRAALADFDSSHQLWVSLSGGADSTALLHALACIDPPLRARLRALHVNHGLHEDASAWCERCAALCRELDIPLHTETVEVRNHRGRGLEAEARALRYAVAERLLGDGDVLLTAHHAQDQAETVLMHLMRGSGLRGLSGIPARRKFGRGWLFRPLLDVAPAALRAYLSEQGVPWVEDSSNEDQSLDRNFVRHRVLPLLAKRWHDAPAQIAVSAQWSREASDFVDSSADALLDRCLWAANVLDLQRLSSACADSPGSWRLVVRRWLERSGAPPLPRARLAELGQQLQQAGRHKAPAVEWSGWRLGRHRQRLWLHRSRDLLPFSEARWDGSRQLELGRVGGQIALAGQAGAPVGRFTLRSRRDGDRVACLDGGGHKAVKSILQEAGIPPWMRDSAPVLLERDEPVAVGSLALARDLRRRLDEATCTLLWTPGDPGLARLVAAAAQGRS